MVGRKAGSELRLGERLSEVPSAIPVGSFPTERNSGQQKEYTPKRTSIMKAMDFLAFAYSVTAQITTCRNIRKPIPRSV
jgi:hypothetical protein